MDSATTTQSDVRGSNQVSPVRGTRTRAVREYEQTIEELKKENFDLKLRIFFIEETINKNFRGISSGDDSDNTVQVIVELKSETESLKNELCSKNQLLQEALNQGEKSAADLNEYQEKFESTLNELKDKNRTLLLQISEFQDRLAEQQKEKEAVESKYKKSSLAIKGLCKKYLTDVEMIPKELRSVVQTAVQAAKENNVEDINVALKEFKDILSQILPTTASKVSHRAHKLEKASQLMNSAEELLKASEVNNRDTTYPTSSSGKSKYAHGSKGSSIESIISLSSEALDETKKLAMSDSREDIGQLLDTIKENEMLKSDKEKMAEILSNLNKTCEELKINKMELQKELSEAMHKVQDLETAIDYSRNKEDKRTSLAHDESLSEHRMESFNQMDEILMEKEALKVEVAEKSKLISHLRETCRKFEEKQTQMQNELHDAASKIEKLESKIKEEKSDLLGSLPDGNKAVQTVVHGDLMQSKLSDKFIQNAGHSNDVDKLKEEIFTLLLTVEQRDKEISDMEEKISSLCLLLEEKDADNLSTTTDEGHSNLKSDLYQRLAHSCSVNNELMNHLRNLEGFMENLLEHKNLDGSSLDDISQTSQFISQLKSCLEESLELSSVLNDQLSICESSKMFDHCDVSSLKTDSSALNRESYQFPDLSKFNFNSSKLEGMHKFHPSIQDLNQKVIGTGKRRLSYSTLYNNAKDATLLDSENVVFLGTSNNEDLLLLLNEKGDPEDVLIRNSSTFSNNGEDQRKRLWDSSAMNCLGEKYLLDQPVDQKYGSNLMNSLVAWRNPCPSSDSDIWSEPDRDVSLQRIGIDVQKSPVSQKSPRRSKLRDKQRSTDDVSSQKNESSSNLSKLHSWSKRRRSIDTSKTSFICKKCMCNSQTTDSLIRDQKAEKDPQQDVINQLTRRCNNQDKQLEDMKRLLKENKNTIQTLLEEKEELSSCVNHLKEELMNLRQSKTALTAKNSEAESHLTLLSSENDSLRNKIEDFEAEMMKSDTLCAQLSDELSDTKSQLQNLNTKCIDFEKQLSSESKLKDELTKKLEDFEDEKEHLQKQIESLTSMRNNLLSNIKAERENRQRVEKDNQELNLKLENSEEQLKSLFNEKGELEDMCRMLSEENEENKNDLFSSNSTCDALKRDLKNIQRKLKNMESKCERYETELNDSAQKRRDIFENLSEVSAKLSSDLSNLQEASKELLDSEQQKLSVDEIISDDLSELDQNNQILRTIEKLTQISNKFDQIIGFVSEGINSFVHRLDQTKPNDEEYQVLQDKIKSNEQELMSLKTENVQLKKHIEDYKRRTHDVMLRNKSYESRIPVLEERLKSANEETEQLSDGKQEVFDSLAGVQNKFSSYLTALIEMSNRFLDPEQIQLEDFLSSPDDGSSPDGNGRILNIAHNLDGLSEKYEEVTSLLLEYIDSLHTYIENESNGSKCSNISLQQKANESELKALKAENAKLKNRLREFKHKIIDAQSVHENHDSKVFATEGKVTPPREQSAENETELDEISQTKRNITNSLTDVIRKLYANLYTVMEMSKRYLDPEKVEMASYQNSSGRFSDLDEDSQILKSIVELSRMIDSFKQISRLLLEHIHSLHLFLDKSKSDNQCAKCGVISNQQKFYENKMNSLKTQNSRLQKRVEELQQGTPETKLNKSLESTIFVPEKRSAASDNDLKENLKNYEGALSEIAIAKQKVLDSLWKVKEKTSSNLQNLLEVAKQFEPPEILQLLVTSSNLSDTSGLDKDTQITNAIEVIMLMSSEIEQLTEVLSKCNWSRPSIQSVSDKCSVLSLQNPLNKSEIDALKSRIVQLKRHIDEFQQKIYNANSLNKSYETKIPLLEKQLIAAENEAKTLRERNEQWQVLIEKYQQALKNNEKNDKDEDAKSTGAQQVDDLRDQVEKYQNLLNAKDDEITKLQERVFNLQTYVYNLLAIASKKEADVSSNAPVENTEALSSPKVSSSGFLVLSNSDLQDNENKDESFSSVSSESTETPKKMNHYLRKIKALQAKLSMTEKRNEILEKEKSDLREELLSQIQADKKLSKSSEDIYSLQEEIEDLKANLETKSSFIKDLKSELFKTCNSLVDKQKEVDETKRRLVASKNNSIHNLDGRDLKLRFSDPIQRSTETNITELKKHKWELIQGILKHQKQFYERKNIHLGHFEKFKNHIEQLRSLQVPASLHKTESEPILNHAASVSTSYAEKCDKTLKNMQIELELDVECLQNLKIFLKRFFIPLVLQSCGCDSKSSSVKKEEGTTSSDKCAVIGNSKMSSLVPDDKRVQMKLDFGASTFDFDTLQSSLPSSNDRLVSAASFVAHKLDLIETALKNVKAVLENVEETDGGINETPKKSAAKSLLLKLLSGVKDMLENGGECFNLNTALKSLGLFEMNVPRSPNKTDLSDRESLLSEETLTLSRSGSLSPMSFDEHLPSKLFGSAQLLKQKGSEEKNNDLGNLLSLNVSQKSHAAGGSQDSIFQRSHFSSPDLGIESDPNHESSAPEQGSKEEDGLKNSLRLKALESGSKTKQWTAEKQRPSTSLMETSLLNESIKIGDTLHAIGNLREYELLRKEVQEGLVGIKAILSRTGDGLQHVSKYTSPRKNLEYSTFKAIKDVGGNIEVCLQEANKLVDNFWIAPCPSVKDLNRLILKIQEQQQQLKSLHDSKRKQEVYFNDVLEKLKQAELLRETMEKKISKKLVKTKKVIRRAEMKMLEKENQELPPIPKYPSQDPTSQKKS